MYNEKEYKKWNKKYKKFQKANKQSITKMVLDFNRKKSADIAKRVKKKDTGVIDERLLHSYRWNDRIFKTKKIVPEGKNHGLIMLVDCSGSMQEYDKFESAIKQALILVDFCRKVGIKYKVVGFGNGNFNATSDQIKYKNDSSKRHLEIKYVPLLREWFSHEQTLKQHDFMATYMMFKTKKFRAGFVCDGPNSGTPLIDSVFLLRQVALKFKKEEKIDILNTITLTDGLSNNATFLDWDRGLVTKLSSYDPLTKSVYRTSDTDDLKNVLKFYKKVVGGNIIGFDITNSGWYGLPRRTIDVREDWQGYDHHYTFSFKSIYDDVKKTARKDKEVPKSLEELSSNFKEKGVSKNNEKILLSKFIDIIS
tara:strand:- start:3 stop:1097 length:1095 start_codon:yes stop_codon:yes gene_type:complete